MTRNQILYREGVEKQRSNLVNEDLTRRRDAEVARANLAREFETHRANVANEAENRRSNMARESENTRSALAKELEAHRHNVATESLTNRQIGVQAQYNAGYLNELNRSNLARELENSRHNMESEDIQNRAQNVSIQTSRYVADTNAAAQKYSADARLAGTRYAANTSASASRYATDQRLVQQEMQNASDMAIEQLRQQGYNERQIKQIAADAVYVLHNDVVKLLESGAGQRTIKDLFTNYYLRQLRK